MKLVYLAGPYTAPTMHQTWEHIMKARSTAATLFKLGFSVHCPHLNNMCMDGYLTRDDIIKADNEVLRRCDAVVVMPDSALSGGTCAEIRLARSLGIPRFYLPVDLQAMIHWKEGTQDKLVTAAQRVDRWGDYLAEQKAKGVEKNKLVNEEYLAHQKTQVRTFDTGASRDTDAGKPDYEGCMSPAAVRRFGAYMLKHSKQSDGTPRSSDNWQKGIPLGVYMKSLMRHVVDAWAVHRRLDGPDLEESLCGVLFNTMGYLTEVLKAKPKHHVPNSALPFDINSPEVLKVWGCKNSSDLTSMYATGVGSCPHST